ncbi:hypothetical protein RRG08_014142 [Elysia crispata]|uniref:Uncharacterized protein n=1 Tax=Elysia crispata TaxID=231223 RepID=A0AAE1AHA8_9GAST|nr:hypothetical protein RRG08_014142 [Elysia crispata]
MTVVFSLLPIQYSKPAFIGEQARDGGGAWVSERYRDEKRGDGGWPWTIQVWKQRAHRDEERGEVGKWRSAGTRRRQGARAVFSLGGHLGTRCVHALMLFTSGDDIPLICRN